MNNKYLGFFGAILVMLLLSVVSFYPILKGEKILQPDIINHVGGSFEQEKIREENGVEPYWTNSMFGGMPTYQLGARFENDGIKYVDQALRFLPRPADYLFLLLFGFFILAYTLVRDWRYALLAGIFFAFSTYFFQIISAGHNAKTHAIAYFAPLVAGILLLYRGKWWVGSLLTVLFLSLELLANHFQMTYYLFLSMLVFVFFKGLEAFKQKQVSTFFKASGLVLLCSGIAIGLNFNRLSTTYQYSQETIRGENLLDPKSKNSGLDSDYITSWSYGKLESLNLLIPNFMGGGSVEPNENKPNTAAFLESVAQSTEEAHYFEQSVLPSIPTYWGDQPYTVGPAYQGAIVCFLALLGLLLMKGVYRNWLLSTFLLSLFLAWGKNFSFLTDFMIEYFPFYNKFRTVSSILVLAEFVFPILAVLGLYHFFQSNESNSIEKRKKILLGLGLGMGTFLLTIYLFAEPLFGLGSPLDSQLPKELQQAIVKDRNHLLQTDTLRSLFFIGLCVGILYLHLNSKLKTSYALAAIGVLTLLDLGGINQRYLNSDNFVDSSWVENPYPTDVTQEMLDESDKKPILQGIVSKQPLNLALKNLKAKDPSHYRVFNPLLGTFSEATTSYFHSSIGGYHGAKLRRYQDVIDKYLTEKPDPKILGMLGVKYVIGADSLGIKIQNNPFNLGNAWFVDEVTKVDTPKQAFEKLSTLDPRKQAVVEVDDNLDGFQNGSTSGKIRLENYLPNKLSYIVESPKGGFVVFSEIFYSKGWNAYVDGVKTPIYATNYVLRGLWLKAGAKKIELIFEPTVVKTAANVSLFFNLLLLLVVIGLVYKIGLEYKQGKSIVGE
ncbi:MAG: hypothetical protein C4K58_06220 [Flavobacteriaceae bacterium]|nr:MAG: hypothetical protein C4K58_06220 [Flavobacteriaceae bacterium]